MRNRNLYFAKIESIEGKMKTLQMMVKMGQPVQDFIVTAQEVEDLLQDMKDMITREPIGPNEN